MVSEGQCGRPSEDRHIMPASLILLLASLQKGQNNCEVKIAENSMVTEKHITQLGKFHTPKILISDKSGGRSEPAQLHRHR